MFAMPKMRDLFENKRILKALDALGASDMTPEQMVACMTRNDVMQPKHSGRKTLRAIEDAIGMTFRSDPQPVESASTMDEQERARIALEKLGRVDDLDLMRLLALRSEAMALLADLTQQILERVDPMARAARHRAGAMAYLAALLRKSTVLAHVQKHPGHATREIASAIGISDELAASLLRSLQSAKVAHERWVKPTTARGRTWHPGPGDA